ncbi:MAG: mechanosensitive ion channel family protein [Clostridiales bacterium]|jgi:small conductance mechanosensitive channel|nr:mechanosensitive ion channel family protein [Clostridiales bacterium]
MNFAMPAGFPSELQAFWEIGVKILLCLAVICAGLLISALVRNTIRHFFQLASKAKMRGGKSETLSSILRNMVKYVIWFLIICQILNIFGVSAMPLVALASVASVGLGFGSQTIVKDLLTGIFILVENQFNVGDVIAISGIHGVVASVGIRITKIRDINGNVHIFPNSSISVVTNMSQEHKRAVINLDFPASHSVERVLGLLSDEVKKAGGLPGLLSPPEVVGLIDLTPSSFKVQIAAECQSAECWPIERELRLRLKQRFEQENIS